MPTKITIENLDKWGACDRAKGKKYSNANLGIFFRNKKSLTLAEILYLKIPDTDKIWAATRAGVMTQKQTDAWLEKIVARSINHHVLNCGITSVEKWGHNWLSGKDRTEKAARAAEKAAKAAAWAAEAAAEVVWAAVAAAAAAKAATWAAVQAVARTAKEVAWAAEEAVWAAEEAAWAAEEAVFLAAEEAAIAAAVEKKKQISDLKEILREKNHEA